MKFYQIASHSDIRKWIEKIGSTKEGRVIMEKKAKINLFYIREIRTPGANILKQEALSVGADVVTPKGVIVCDKRFSDVILLGTASQLERLIKKLKVQPFGLKEFALELSKFLYLPKFSPKIMGILNVNKDSFFQGSRHVGEEAIQHIRKMIEDGADMVDVGGVSSRPGSDGVSDEEELRRVKPVIDAIYEDKIYEKAVFSLDSYSPLCLEYALDRGFGLVNDITALSNDEVAKVSGKYDAIVCLMHMQNDPKTMQQEPYYEDIISEVDEFFAARIQKAQDFGVNKIVLDVGIGFGKNLEHNLALLKHQKHFLHFGYELLVGASRKSMVNAIEPASISERLPGTLAIHLEALRNGASIIRCHDVKEHKQAIEVYKAMNEGVL